MFILYGHLPSSIEKTGVSCSSEGGYLDLDGVIDELVDEGVIAEGTGDGSTGSGSTTGTTSGVQPIQTEADAWDVVSNALDYGESFEEVGEYWDIAEGELEPEEEVVVEEPEPEPEPEPDLPEGPLQPT